MIAHLSHTSCILVMEFIPLDPKTVRPDPDFLKLDVSTNKPRQNRTGEIRYKVHIVYMRSQECTDVTVM